MKKYYIHADYLGCFETNNLLVWVEIIETTTNSIKIATRDELSRIFELHSPIIKSYPFNIPHRHHKQILFSNIKENINKEDILLYKKYIDCIVVKFSSWSHFLQITKNTSCYFCPSLNYFTSLVKFCQQILYSKNFIPAIKKSKNKKGYMVYNIYYQPIQTPIIKNFINEMIKYYPPSSMWNKEIKNCHKFYLKKFIDSYFNKAVENAKLHISSIENINYPSSQYVYDIWKKWNSDNIHKAKIKIRLNEKEIDSNLWKMEFFLEYENKTYNYSELIKKKLLNDYFFRSILEIASFSKYVRDLVNSTEKYTLLSLKELIDFMKSDAKKIIERNYAIEYPKFLQNTKKITASVEFKTSTHKYFTHNLLNKKQLLEFHTTVYAGEHPISLSILKQHLQLKNKYFWHEGNFIQLDLKKLDKFINKIEKDNHKFKNGISVIEAINYHDNNDIKVNRTSLMKKFSPNIFLKPISKSQLQFNGKLRQYQAKGVELINKMASLGFGIILADDMGLGKTIQVIYLLTKYYNNKKNLIIVPTSIVYNWKYEFEKFAPDMHIHIHYGAERTSNIKNLFKKYSVIITSYGILKRDIQSFAFINYDFVILDEAQNIKNSKSQQTKIIKSLHSKNYLALTGTPIENRLLELWSIMDFVNPGLLLSEKDFFSQYELPIAKHNNPHTKLRLKQIITPFIIRRMKNDKDIIKDLPLKQESKIYVNLSPMQVQLYDHELKLLKDQLSTKSEISRGAVLSTITKLKQICNHPYSYNDNLLYNNKISEVSGKLQRLIEMIEVILDEDKKCLIFTQYIKMGTILEKYIAQITGKTVKFFYGKLPLKKRQKMIDDFQNNNFPIMIMSLKAGGVGFNLTAANYVIHYDRWWNPAVENQAIDRVYRIGQKQNIFVYKFITRGSLEEKIDKLMETKQRLSSEIIPDNNKFFNNLDYQQLIKLLERNNNN